MIRWALRKGIDKFEREWNYDASYIRDVIDASPRAAWLFSRVTGVLAAAALVGGFGLAAPAAAHVSVQPAAASNYAMSSGRLGATAAAVLGLIGVVIGGLAMARPAGRFGTGSGRLGAIVALAAGLIAMALGGLVVATADGGIGTGNGLGGAIVALVLGPIGLVIGGLVVATADGGLGTGNGLGGGVVAMMVGLIGMALGGLALARYRRTG